jgi:hypothetical protein
MMKVLSIRQPWAFAILHLGKDVENGDWATRFRGRIAIHASQGMTGFEYKGFCEYVGLFVPEMKEVIVPASELPRGAIVGTVEIVDCKNIYRSRWFQGNYGFVLRNPVALSKPIACKGALGFWDLPKEIEKQLNEQLLPVVTSCEPNQPAAKNESINSTSSED